MDKTELKRKVEATGSLFFTRNNMRFLGDKMSNYYVPVKPVEIYNYKGVKVKCWKLRRIRQVKHLIQSSAYFDVDTFEKVCRYRKHPKTKEFIIT